MERALIAYFVPDVVARGTAVGVVELRVARFVGGKIITEDVFFRAGTTRAACILVLLSPVAYFLD